MNILFPKCKLGSPTRLVGLLLFCLCGVATAQSIEGKLTQYTADEGLALMAVHRVVEDRHGFIWVATQDGLNRFDGYHFETFRQQGTDPNGLPDNYVTELYIDPNGLLFVGTGNGLCYYDESMNHFVSVPLPDPRFHDVRAVHALPDGRLLVGTYAGLLLLDLKTGGARQIPIDSARPNQTVFRIISHPEQGIFLSVFSGIRQYLPQEERLIPLSLGGTVYSGLAFDHSGNLYLGTPRKNYVRRPGGEFEELSGVTNRIRHWHPAPDGSVWAGSNRSLYNYDANKQLTVPFENTGWLGRDVIINSLYVDTHGRLWICTHGQGLFVYDGSTEVFGHVRRLNPTQNNQTLIAQCFAEDASGQIWVGTHTTFYRWDNRGKNFDESWALSMFGGRASTVSHMLFDRRNRLWIAVNGIGVYRVDNPDADLGPRQPLPAFTANSPVWFYETRRGDIWVASLDRGAFHYREGRANVTNISTTSFSQFPSNTVQTASEDLDGVIWLGTSQGLVRYLEEKNEIEIFTKGKHQLSHNSVWTILHTRDGGRWAGTQRGLNRWEPNAGRFRSYFIEDGLPNDHIYGLLEDDQGFIWMSTNQGLTRMNPKTDSFMNFGVQDGLQALEYNSGSYLKRADGFMAFGGVNGFNLFHPEKVISHHDLPQTLITDFLQRNQSVPIGRGGILPKAISRLDVLELDYRDRSFGFEFTAPGARAPDRIRFAYMMEGLDKDWVATSSARRFSNYTNLAPGSYTFRVKALNRRNQAGEEANITILIKPPFYSSRVAYVLYVLALILVVGGFLLYQRRLRRFLEEQVAERTASLDLRNSELVALDLIASAINREHEPDKVLQVLTEQVHRNFKGADRVSCIIHDLDTGYCRFAGQTGFERAYPLIKVKSDYILDRFRQGTEEIAAGVFLGHHYKEKVADQLGELPVPMSLIALDLGWAEHGGFLIIDNKSDPVAFDHVDTETLIRIRSHAISAWAKARSIRELMATRAELVETARETGMAELAMEVLHHVGNQTNSAKTSAQVLLEEIRRDWPDSGLERLAQAIKSNRPEDAHQLEKAPIYLVKLADKLRQRVNKLESEATLLDGHLQALTQSLIAQQQHTFKGPELELLDFNNLAHQLINENRYTLERHKVEVQCVPFEEPLLIEANAHRLKRVLLYLLENALEAMPATGATLILETRRVGDEACLKMSDNGEGIDASHLDMVFRAGFTTREEHRGFGLHYSANALREMKGRLDLESSGLKRGTVVTVLFPLAGSPLPVAHV